MLNAISVAKALELDFRFSWPRTKEWGFSNPLEIFGEDYFSYFVVPQEFPRKFRPIRDITQLSRSEARQTCKNARASSVISIDECFEIVRFADESEESAHARFLEGFSDIGWSQPVKNLIAAVHKSKFAGKYSALHLRSGDIVVGSWKQFVPTEKYLPKPYVELIIRKLAEVKGDRVALLSDNRAYADELRHRFEEVIFSEDFFQNYESLTEVQQSICDIVVMFASKQIFGPHDSAFSGLAARLQGTLVYGIANLMESKEASKQFQDYLNQLSEERETLNALQRQVLARDICWYLNVFSDELRVQDRLLLAKRAFDFDPKYCGALSQYAIVQALAERHKEARDLANRALKAASQVDRHEDPFAESLATCMAVEMLDPAAREQRVSIFPERLESVLEKISRLRIKSLRVLKRWSAKAGFGKRLRTSHALFSPYNMPRNLSEFQRLTPFQIHKDPVLRNLRFQVAAKDGLARIQASGLEALKSANRSYGTEPSRFGSWRTDAFESMRSRGRFPEVLRRIETVSIIMASALSDALAADPVFLEGSIDLDAITTDPTGLKWAHGWAFCGSLSVGPDYIGVLHDGKIISAGVISLPRPNVGSSQHATQPSYCGFAIPLPLFATSVSLNSMRIIRAKD